MEELLNREDGELIKKFIQRKSFMLNILFFNTFFIK